jgi:hypothetical protein
MKIRLILFLFLTTHYLLAQNVSFTARAGAKQVPLGATVDVTFVLRNASMKNPQLPSFNGFQVISRDTGQSKGFINGVRNDEENIYFTLRPKSLGILKIDPATITIKGKTYRTNPIQIEVVKSTSISKIAKNDIFLKLESEVTTAYLNAPIILEVRVFSNQEISGNKLLNQPDFTSFYHQKMDYFDENPVKELYKGSLYQTKVISRYLLYPQKTGKFTINPFSFEVETLNGFDSRIISLSSNQITINVLDLPSNPPKLFNGAVGSFQMTTNFDKKEISTDEALSFQVTIEGRGDTKRINAPIIASRDSFEVYEPKIISEITENETSKKVFEYTMIAKYAGVYSIHPEFSFFDNEKKTYKKISTLDKIQFSQGTGQKKQEITPQVIEDAKEKENKFYFYFLISGAFIGLFIWVGNIVFKRFRKKQILVKENNSTSFVNNIQEENKPNFLAIAAKNLEQQQLDNFYKNLVKAVEDSIASVTKLKNASRTELLSNLSNTSKAHLTNILQNILEECDIARFGGMNSNKNPHVLLEKTEQIIQELTNT